MNQVLFVLLIPILSLFGEMTCSNMNTSNQLSDEINEQQIMIKFSKNLELIYSGNYEEETTVWWKFYGKNQSPL